MAMEGPGPSTTSTVSASGVEAIETTLDVTPQAQISSASIEEIYDVESTVEELLNGGWTRVCLQFPDELLHASVKVFKAIRKHLPDSVELYVMADTTYGSCCVDEVAAQHVDGQIVVHYGHACLSAPARLAVLYVFPKAPINAAQAASTLTSEIKANSEALQDRRHLVLMSDVAYYWQLDAIHEQLQSKLQDTYTVIKADIDTKTFLHPSDTANARPSTSTNANGEGCSQPQASNTTKSTCRQKDNGDNSEARNSANSSCNCESRPRQVPVEPTAEGVHEKRSCRSYTLPNGVSLRKDCGIIYVGPESFTLTNLLLSNVTVPVISYAPPGDGDLAGTSRLESGRTNKMLMRRYGVISKARDADVFGIVVGTLGVSSYLPTLTYLRKLLRKHQKKSYTMAVGKLTPAKLGNFLEVETWILVACGENSLVEGHKDFLRPIITPWELEVALGERDWLSSSSTDPEESGYTLDFGRILSDSKGKVEGASGEDVQNGGSATKYGLEDEDDPEGPVFSTATGQYRYRKTYGGKGDVKDAADLATQASALAIRNTQSALATVLSSAGGEYMATRTYKGLDPRYGADLPSAMEIGRSGVAREYGGDLEAKATKLDKNQRGHSPT